MSNKILLTTVVVFLSFLSIISLSTKSLDDRPTQIMHESDSSEETANNNNNNNDQNIPPVRMRPSLKHSCDEIHQDLVSALFLSTKNIFFQQQNRRWTPQLCSTRWNVANKTELFSTLDSLGWNITNGRKIQPDKKLGITDEDRCASYDTGVFATRRIVNENIVHNHHDTSPWKSTLPTIYSLPSPPSSSSSSGVVPTRLPKIESKDLVGSNFALFIAAGIHKIGEGGKFMENGDQEEKTVAPPWIVLIGDSRMRQLLMRLISMIRSQFVVSETSSSTKNNKRQQDFSASAEMRTGGLIEHYFHASATYTVFGYKTKNEKGVWSFFPTSDRLYVLPDGAGCDADQIAQQQANCSSSTKNNCQILFRICFWWHVRTKDLLARGSDFLSRRLKGGVGAAAWMPNLHECTARNESHCVPAARLREMIPELLEMMGNVTSSSSSSSCPRSSSDSTKEEEEDSSCSSFGDGGGKAMKIKNLVVISAPRPGWAPVGISDADARNLAVMSGMRDWYEMRHPLYSSSSSTSTSTNQDPFDIFPRFKSEKQVSLSMKHKKKKLAKKEQKSPSSSPQVWFMDMAAWWEKQTPRLCDQMHSMCNLVPMRPMMVDNVKKLCDGCKDPSGFVAVAELMRLLLSEGGKK